ncbi:hypothetical protein BN389_14200 [Listeria monocytogenes serotype 4b str. LL195]|nr:hypothetical protein BN389_14200 [Listeria monocytogenes serotype 4b str. LL195]
MALSDRVILSVFFTVYVVALPDVSPLVTSTSLVVSSFLSFVSVDLSLFVVVSFFSVSLLVSLLFVESSTFTVGLFVSVFTFSVELSCLLSKKNQTMKRINTINKAIRIFGKISKKRLRVFA